MSGIIEGYNYDIFISYRQKDNKYDGWVTGFVDNLKKELEATFKEDISVYFDINPHDGLLETHDVDASLKEKIKCLVLIPIISHTYCDPKSFAWEHEFKAFVEQASQDKFGLKVRLPNGNVANRVLPVRIHDLDNDDIKLCESILGGVLRGVEFIYKEAGVNRPLRSKEDNPGDNLNKTFYRNQVNKVANAVKEIILGLKAEPSILVKESFKQSETSEEAKKEEKKQVNKKSCILNNRKLLSGVLIASILVIAAILAYPRIFKRDTIERLRSSGEKISIAVMPFQNMTNDTSWNVGDVIQQSLISAISDTRELGVRQKETMDNLLKTKGLTEYASISPATAVTISKKLDTDLYIYGSIQKAGPLIRVEAQLIDTKTKVVIKPFREERPSAKENIFSICDSLGKKVIDFLRISKLIKENQSYIPTIFNTNSPEALRYYISGIKAQGKFDLPTAIDFYLRAIKADSNFLPPKFELIPAYKNSGKIDKSRSLIIDLYRKKDQMSPIDQLITKYRYAEYFEPPGVRINYLKQLVEIDDQGGYHYQLARAYGSMNQTDKAISELEKALDIFRNWGKEFLKEDLVLPALGEAYHRTGQYKKARKIYREAERVNDDHTSIYFSYIIRNQAALSLTEGDSIAANKYIEELKSVLKENSLSEADIEAQLALMYRQAGNLGKAEEYVQKILLSDPENPERMYVLAWFLIDNDRDITEGLRIIDKALVLKPDNYKYLDTKGWGLYKQGKYKEALEFLEKSRDLYKPYYSYGISSHIEEVKKAIANQ